MVAKLHIKGGVALGTGWERYSFVSLWHIHAPIEAVWEAIFHSERWTNW